MSLMTQVGLEFVARDSSRSVIASFTDSIHMTGRSIQTLGRNVLALAGVGGGFYMLGNMLRSGVREAAAFEKQMAEVSTMLNEQSISLMPRYTDQIRAMSREFGEGTETLSKGLYDILSASIAPAEALDVLAVSTRAAKAGLTDTGTAADVITTILNSYSLEASRAGDISDKLFNIVFRGKTIFSELAPNIGKVAALAATAGESFDDLGAAIATMTRAGVKTDIAVTSLRAIILSFLKPQSDSIEMARKYGVELNSNTLRTIGLTGVIEKLKKATAEELAVIVPTSRAITGFAAAVQKSDELAGDYDLMLNSLGATETAYQKIAATSAHQLDQLNQEWIDMKRAVGDLATGPLIGFLTLVRKGVEEISQAVDNSRKAIENFNNYITKHGLASAGKQTYGSWAPMPEVKAPLGPSAEGAAMKAEIERQQTLAMMAAMQLKGLSSFQFPEREIKAPERNAGYEFIGPPEPGKEYLAARKKIDEQIVADTREKLTSIRAMDDLTRMEKIQNLKAYMAEHADTLAGVAEAEKLLSDEMESILKSRSDAMKVYCAELREDFQSLGLYISEKFAEASRSIESGLSGAFLSLREEGSNFRSFMVNVFTSIQDSFAKMLADMAARAMMNAAVAPVMNVLSGVLGGALGSLFGGIGNQIGSPNYAPNYSTTSSNAGVPIPESIMTGKLHGGWVPEGVPSFQGGRGLKSNEMAAIIEKDELLAPAGQVIRSPFSRGGSAPNVIINNNTGRPIEQDGPPQFDGEKWVVALVAKNISEGGSLSKLMKK